MILEILGYRVFFRFLVLSLGIFWIRLCLFEVGEEDEWELFMLRVFEWYFIVLLYIV